MFSKLSEIPIPKQKLQSNGKNNPTTFLNMENLKKQTEIAELFN